MSNSIHKLENNHIIRISSKYLNIFRTLMFFQNDVERMLLIISMYTRYLFYVYWQYTIRLPFIFEDSL